MRVLVELTLPNEPRLLGRIRRTVLSYLEALEIDRETASDVVLALDEACTNVIRHAFPSPRVDTFRLTADLSEHEIVLVVEDYGVGFLPGGVAPGGPDANSGRGLAMIRRLMTSVDIDSIPTRRGTRLRMCRSVASVA